MCAVLGLQRNFRAVQVDGLLRVKVYDADAVVRDVAPERIHVELRRLQALHEHRRALRPADTGPQRQPMMPEDERRASRAEQRVVLLQTLRLAGTLRTQLKELQRRGGHFSPFED